MDADEAAVVTCTLSTLHHVHSNVETRGFCAKNEEYGQAAFLFSLQQKSEEKRKKVKESSRNQTSGA
jgi:hypothetical protein